MPTINELKALVANWRRRAGTERLVCGLLEQRGKRGKADRCFQKAVDLDACADELEPLIEPLLSAIQEENVKLRAMLKLIRPRTLIFYENTERGTETVATALTRDIDLLLATPTADP